MQIHLHKGAGFCALPGRMNPALRCSHSEALDRLARRNGLCLTADHEMPVNNRTPVWIHTQGECADDC